MGHHASVEKKGPGLAKLTKLAKQLGINPEVRIGIFQGTAGRDGNGGLTNVEVGIINHFGAPSAGIPERPFLTTAADSFQHAWMDLFERLLQKVIDDKLTVDQALGLLGQRASADVKHVLLTASWPPNAPSTIAQKGSSRPLVDTSQLVNSITYRVEK